MEVVRDVFFYNQTYVSFTGWVTFKKCGHRDPLLQAPLHHWGDMNKRNTVISNRKVITQHFEMLFIICCICASVVTSSKIDLLWNYHDLKLYLAHKGLHEGFFLSTSVLILNVSYFTARNCWVQLPKLQHAMRGFSASLKGNFTAVLREERAFHNFLSPVSFSFQSPVCLSDFRLPLPHLQP